MAQAPVILLNGLPVKTTYMANCRLCLGTNFGDSSTTIVEERFSVMLMQVFPFPIPNQIGLPMNVCSKCRKGVELFSKYTKKVQTNQKKLEETFIKVDLPNNQQTGNTNSVAQDRGSQNPTTNRGQAISNVVEIVSDDEFQNDKDDNLIEVDMQCEPVTDTDEHNYDSHGQSTSYEDTQTHFVAVPGPANVFRCSETVGFERIKKCGTRPAVEVISLSDDECEERAQIGDRNDKRKKHATHNQHSIPKPQSSRRASSRAIPAATMENNVSYLDEPIDNLTGGVVMVYYEADDVEEMKATTSSAVSECTKKAPSSKRNMRSTVKAPNAKQRTTRSSTSGKGHKKV